MYLNSKFYIQTDSEKLAITATKLLVLFGPHFI